MYIELTLEEADIVSSAIDDMISNMEEDGDSAYKLYLKHLYSVSGKITRARIEESKRVARP